MPFDAVILARLQFALTISFHILFPTLTIGLALFLVILEALWLRTGQAVYITLYRFWVKIFALSFGMGVVSGVVLSYQFGTNFARFSEVAGNILGPLLGYEVLTAFFLEASFLGVMLFGMNRVSPRIHFLATCIVALGTMISAFWILAASSWMHTPAGYRLVDGIFHVESWPAVIFNPSFFYRFPHMLMASFLTTSLVVAGVSAWHLQRIQSAALARPAFAIATLALAILAPLQIVMGDLHGLQVQRHQPMKIAAMEGLWETTAGAPLLVFAWPDMAAERNHFEIAIPKLASLILQHDSEGTVLGLKEVAPADRPLVPLVFFSFRIMVGLGFWFLFLGVVGLLLRWRGTLFSNRPYALLCMASAPLGFVATLAGWIVTETGRQPWIVQGLMRTSEAVSAVPARAILTTLSLFVAVYGTLLLAYLYYLSKLIRQGPDVAATQPDHDEPTRTAWM
ncbi:MAG: cytochrome ubiquinol oxidase subunit I [Candidatus Macondimonas sp.]